MLSKELQNTLLIAIAEAKSRRHEYVMLEHVLWAMLRGSKAKQAMGTIGADTKQIGRDLERFFRENVEPLPDDDAEIPDPLQTPAFQRVLQRALIQAQSAGKRSIDSINVLISFYKEAHCFAVYLLEKHGVSRLSLMSYASDEVDDSEGDDAEEGASGEEGEKKPFERSGRKSLLKNFAVDLCAKAREGKLDPMIGRERELERMIQILCRRRKNNPLLLGDPGVGKTAIVEGLAQRIVQEQVPTPLKGATIFSIDMGSLLAGTKFRGEFESRLKNILKEVAEHTNAIVFIDEIHTIYGAGATGGGALDASNLIKPALASGQMHCIGSTTYQEYKNVFDKDRALSRRFQTIDVAEPSVSDTVQILKGLKTQYEAHHHVQYDDAALQSAAELAAKHINERLLPDKAIDVIDEAGASVQLQPEAERKVEIGAQEIERIVAKIARIPEKSVSASDKERLGGLTQTLRSVIYGQDQAIEAVVSAIKLSRSGLSEPNKPIGSFLFSGPTGVGKTELAKQLAKAMGIEFIRFDMSEYMEKHTVSRLVGAPPGYVGFDQGGLLTDAVRKTPHAVLVLDEIEKAHPDIYNILLQVMDHATLTDNNGRKADFRQMVLVLTTNAGAHELTKSSLGFHDVTQGKKDKSAIEKTFSPEFRNRLDAWVTFNMLDVATIDRVIDKFIDALSAQLKEKSVTLILSDEARVYLREKGYDKTMGARPMARLIQNEIKRPLAEEILFGQLEHGGEVRVVVESGRLAVHALEAAIS